MPHASISEADAFTHYAALSEPRSIAALERHLKAQGFGCSRNTLARWQKKNRWDEVVADARKNAVVAVQGEILNRIADESVETVEGFEKALGSLEETVTAMNDVVKRALDTIKITEVSDLVELAKAAASIATSSANIRKAVGEAALARKTGEPAPSTGHRIMDPDPESAEGFQNWRRHRGL
jgi:hypothetical protein